MYDRAERFGSFLTQTPKDVAPNTYLIPEELRIYCEGAAPFLTQAKRFPKKAAEKFPGPGAYDEVFVHHIKGGVSPSYRAARFRYPRPKFAEPPPTPEKPPAVGKLQRGPVPYSLLGRPPSIPPRRGFCGYRSTAYGQVVALKGDMGDSYICRDCCSHCRRAGARCHCRIAGGRGECYTTLRYKGCFFSRRTSARQTFCPRPGPGPADYDVDGRGPSQAELINEAIRGWKRLHSAQPRFLDIVQLRTVREGLPAPGQYEVHVTEKRKPGKKPWAFLTTSKRFAEPSSRAAWPDPCRYNVRSDLLDNRPGSIIGASFLKTAPRFPPPPIEEAPGPGAYELKSTLGAAAAASRLRSAGAPFDSTDARRTGVEKPKAELEPGPNAYALPTPPTRGRGWANLFKSTTPQTAQLKPKEGPDCWTYNPREPGAALCSHHRGDLSFTVRANRFGRVYDWPSTRVEPKNPGPGSYSQERPQLCRRPPSYSLFGDSPRCTLEKPRAPGPNRYTLDRSLDRRTFNVTLATPERRQLRARSECAICPCPCVTPNVELDLPQDITNFVFSL